MESPQAQQNGDGRALPQVLKNGRSMASSSEHNAGVFRHRHGMYNQEQIICPCIECIHKANIMVALAILGHDIVQCCSAHMRENVRGAGLPEVHGTGDPQLLQLASSARVDAVISQTALHSAHSLPSFNCWRVGD